MGRSVEDLALLADALQAYDENDPASLTSSRPRLLPTATEDWPLAPLFVLVKTHAWQDADPATHEAFGELAEHLGGQIEEISLDQTTDRGIAAAMTVQRVELAYHFGPLLDRAPDLISKPLAELIEEGLAPKGLDATGNPVFCRFWTYLGVPAVSLPLLEVEGMPMGVQLIGARGDDGRLLRTARWLARHLAKAD